MRSYGTTQTPQKKAISPAATSEPCPRGGAPRTGAYKARNRATPRGAEHLTEAQGLQQEAVPAGGKCGTPRKASRPCHGVKHTRGHKASGAAGCHNSGRRPCDTAGCKNSWGHKRAQNRQGGDRTPHPRALSPLWYGSGRGAPRTTGPSKIKN